MSDSNHPNEYRGIKIGDRVTICKESGNRHNRIQVKFVESISVTNWTPEEAARLRVPKEECVFGFTDRSTGHYGYDRVTKAEEVLKI